MFVNS